MSDHATPKLALTVEETAEALTVSIRTVERLIANGELRSRKIGWRRVVPLTALTEYLDHPTSIAHSQILDG